MGKCRLHSILSSHFCCKKCLLLNKIRLLMVVQQYLMDSFSWTGKSPLLKYNASSSDTYYTTMKIVSVANSAFFGKKIKGGSTLPIFPRHCDDKYNLTIFQNCQSCTQCGNFINFLFSTQILREINFGDYWSAKSANFRSLKTLFLVIF